jgi:hypothetical protein
MATGAEALRTEANDVRSRGRCDLAIKHPLRRGPCPLVLVQENAGRYRLIGPDELINRRNLEASDA